MPYNEETVQRIRVALDDKGVAFEEKAMFGGICFMVDDKMLCASKIDKRTGDERLMCRLGEARAAEAVEDPAVVPMSHGGRCMPGFVYVSEEGYRTAADLKKWLQLSLDYNPEAKKSGKK
jgi:hypothetical protein